MSSEGTYREHLSALMQLFAPHCRCLRDGATGRTEFFEAGWKSAKALVATWYGRGASDGGVTMINQLDAVVAGVIWRDGPITAYRIREVFKQSLSPAWSSSAGTIYPTVGRLIRGGLVAATRL